jgi:hypothetical protein
MLFPQENLKWGFQCICICAEPVDGPKGTETCCSNIIIALYYNNNKVVVYDGGGIFFDTKH